MYDMSGTLDSFSFSLTVRAILETKIFKQKHFTDFTAANEGEGVK